MADFNASYALVERWENIKTSKGLIIYSNTQGDKGGETVSGISRRAHPNMPLWLHVDALKSKGIVKPIDLSKRILENSVLMAEIKYFYKAEYWDKLRCDEIDNQNFADNLMLLGVNAGIKKAIIVGQRACKITSDGVFGNKTLAAFKKADKAETKRFTEIEIEFYQSIAARDKSQERFLQGWINRAKSV